MKWLRRNVWRLLIAAGAAVLALGYVPESHRAEVPAEEASLEEGEHEEGNPQQHQPAEPCARGERAEEAQDGTEAREERT